MRFGTRLGRVSFGRQTTSGASVLNYVFKRGGGRARQPQTKRPAIRLPSIFSFFTEEDSDCVRTRRFPNTCARVMPPLFRSGSRRRNVSYVPGRVWGPVSDDRNLCIFCAVDADECGGAGASCSHRKFLNRQKKRSRTRTKPPCIRRRRRRRVDNEKNVSYSERARGERVMGRRDAL